MKKLTTLMGQYFQSKIYDLIKELKKPSAATGKLKKELIEYETPKVVLKELDYACAAAAKDIKEEILRVLPKEEDINGSRTDISIAEFRKRLKEGTSNGKLVIDFKKKSGDIKVWEVQDFHVFGVTLWDSSKWDFYRRKGNKDTGKGKGRNGNASGNGNGNASGSVVSDGIWSRGMPNSEWISYIAPRVLKRFFRDDPWIGKIIGKPSSKELLRRVKNFGGINTTRSFDGIKVLSAARHKKGISSIVLDAAEFLGQRISGGVVYRGTRYLRDRYGYKLGEGKVEFYDKLRGAGTSAGGGGYRKESVVATLEDKGLREYRNWVNRSRGESIRSTLSMKFHMDNVLKSIGVEDYRRG